MDANERRADLQAEDARLAQESASYRGYLKPGPPPPKRDERPVHVVLQPVAVAAEGDVRGRAIANPARVCRNVFAEKHPELDVRRESDIQRISTVAGMAGPLHGAESRADGRISAATTRSWRR